MPVRTHPYASLPKVLKRGDKSNYCGNFYGSLKDLGQVGEMKGDLEFYRIQWSQNGRDEDILLATGDPQEAPN
jgi:hypothetical protein